MTSEISFKLYELFIPLVKEEAKAKAIVTNIETIIENRFENEKDRIASKQDITHLRSEMKEEISELRIEMKDQKAEMIKWMFIFWTSSVIATLGGLIAIVRFMIVK